MVMASWPATVFGIGRSFAFVLVSLSALAQTTRDQAMANYRGYHHLMTTKHCAAPWPDPVTSAR
jgi:hypothetical protein